MHRVPIVLSSCGRQNASSTERACTAECTGVVDRDSLNTSITSCNLSTELAPLHEMVCQWLHSGASPYGVGSVFSHIA